MDPRLYKKCTFLSELLIFDQLQFNFWKLHLLRFDCLVQLAHAFKKSPPFAVCVQNVFTVLYLLFPPSKHFAFDF